MNTKTKSILELAQEARELIFEFINEESLIAEVCIKDVSIDENGEILYVEDIYNGLENYHITEISKVFLMQMEGRGPFSASFYEALNISIDNLEFDYKKMSKDDFKEYAGNLHYMQYKCEEIYDKLKNIQKEALNLVNIDIV